MVVMSEAPAPLPARVWRGAQTFAESRAALPSVFVLALFVYAVESVAVPIHAGRDFGGYVLNYVHFFESDPVVPIWSLTRAPVASFASVAPLDLGGPWLGETWMAVLFAGSVVCWTAAAAAFGTRAALFTAVALLVFPAYGILFHALASDSLTAAAFALEALLLVRATAKPTAGRFAAAGLAVAVLTLVRPGNQVLAVLALVPLVLPLRVRRRLALAAAFLVACLLPPAAWAVHNGLRYDDFAVVRGSNGQFFTRPWLHGLVSPDNGPASRALAAAVEKNLLPLEPYRSYDVDLDEFFSSRSFRMQTDLYALSDRIWGWDTDYEILRKAGWEAIKAHPTEFARQVAANVASELRLTLYAPVPSGDGGGAAAQPEYVTIRGRRLPKPTEGQPIPSSHYSGHVQSADGGITEVWTSPTEHRIVFRDPSDQVRYDELNQEAGELSAELRDRGGNAWLAERLNEGSRWFPRAVVWLVIGLVAIAMRRPRGVAAPLALAGGALVVVVTTALVVDALAEYIVPLSPAFVLLAAVGLFGERSRPTSQGEASV